MYIKAVSGINKNIKRLNNLYILCYSNGVKHLIM